MIRKHAVLGLVLAAGAVLSGCSLDLQDPNLPTQDQVLGSADGIKAVAIGLQAEYSNQIVDPIYVTGLVASELGAGAATFAIYMQLDAGQQFVENNLDPMEAPWSGQYRVIKLANDLLDRAPDVGFGPGTTSGILAMAELYKAMALGNLIQIYQSIPLDVGLTKPTPTFNTRAEALADILQLLNDAHQKVQSTPPSAQFTSEILAPGLSLGNTIDAMIARYSLISGDYSGAMTAAARVDTTVLSEFRFSSSDQNALYNMWYGSGNAYQMRPRQEFRLQAEAGDERVGYWVTAADIQGANETLDDHNKYGSPTASIPAYLPDEMRLIMAEASARQNDLAQARIWVNLVRTQCDQPLDVPQACLSALSDAELGSQDAILAQIYVQRRYSLYLQGVSWEDERRFNRPMKYDWMPVPFSECDRNPNAPCS